MKAYDQMCSNNHKDYCVFCKGLQRQNLTNTTIIELH